jgi:SAM-dependent methyltransferase
VDSRLPDELALAGPEHLDPAAVARYEQKAGFDPEPDIRLLQELGLQPDSLVVDLGAGTGSFAFAAAAVAARVVAVDVSPAMVEAMQARLIPNIEPVNAGFLTYDHVGEPADFVYSRNALHHLPDYWKGIALTRIASLLRPGGILRLRDLVYSFEPDDAEAILEAWIARGAIEPSAGWTREELRAHVRDEHSTFGWIMEGLLSQAGFRLDDVQYDSSKIYAAYVAVKP